MSKFTLELGKLTPVADVMVEKYSFLTAGVYGLIWRHESMADSVCKAAQTTMAKQLGINAETLRVHIQKLIDDGYIEDLTPGLRNRPHLYKTTGRLKLSLQIVSDAENPR